jgi:hypothetical protein
LCDKNWSLYAKFLLSCKEWCWNWSNQKQNFDQFDGLTFWLSPDVIGVVPIKCTLIELLNSWWFAKRLEENKLSHSRLIF